MTTVLIGTFSMVVSALMTWRCPDREHILDLRKLLLQRKQAARLARVRLRGRQIPHKRGRRSVSRATSAQIFVVSSFPSVKLLM